MTFKQTENWQANMDISRCRQIEKSKLNDISEKTNNNNFVYTPQNGSNHTLGVEISNLYCCIKMVSWSFYIKLVKILLTFIFFNQFCYTASSRLADILLHMETQNNNLLASIIYYDALQSQIFPSSKLGGQESRLMTFLCLYLQQTNSNALMYAWVKWAKHHTAD